MFASTSFSSRLVHELLVESHTRRLLFIQDPLNQAPANAPASTSTNNSTDHSYFGASEFDANVVMILAILLCAFICLLGLNSIIRCAFGYLNISSNSDSSSSSSSSSSNTSPGLGKQGIKKKALKTFPTVSYDSADSKQTGLDTECVICISEFKKGEKVRILPKCNHGFHVKCIDKWLRQHSSCPTCRHCLIETCQKIVGSQQTVLPVPQTIIRIHPLPLEHEALERNYREES